MIQESLDVKLIFKNGVIQIVYLKFQTLSDFM